MGLMMSVLVFSIGVLEALACVEHVRLSYLPLDLGRKRRRLVLDVGSGTIRHREMRRSSEFQRDPHLFLRSIQAAVEEEGDEKESEELAAIFQAIEAHNIHSTQIISNHQDSVFLTVNDVDEGDSRASSDISHTSTPNTVIMNISPELDRGQILEPCYIPSDCFSEFSGAIGDKSISNQKDISITQVNLGQFMCIREQEIPFKSIDSNVSDIDKVFQLSSSQNEYKDSSVCTIGSEPLTNEKMEINEGNGISSIDVQSVDFSTPANGSCEEKTTENFLLNDANKIAVSLADEEVTCRDDEIESNSDPLLLKTGKNEFDKNVINKSIVNFESQTISLSAENNEVSLKPLVNNDNVINLHNELQINHTMNENSSTLSNIYIKETDNRKTIEKSEILVRSQPNSGKEPLIENKDKDKIFETQLEQVMESEKQSIKHKTQSPILIKNSINVSLDTINYENNQKQIRCNDESHSTDNFSKFENLTIAQKQGNKSFQEVSLRTPQSIKPEMVSINLDESKKMIIPRPFTNDASSHQIPELNETIFNSENKITEISNQNPEVYKLQVALGAESDPCLMRTDVCSELNKTVDPGLVNLDKKLTEETADRRVEVNNRIITESTSICNDNNSNIVKDTPDRVPDTKALPENDLAKGKIITSQTPESTTMDHVLLPPENPMNFYANRPKDQIEPAPEYNVTIASRTGIDEKEQYVKGIFSEEKVVEELSEANKIRLEDAKVDAHHGPESMREILKSEVMLDESRLSENISKDTVNLKREFGSDKENISINFKIVEESVSDLPVVVSEEQTVGVKSDSNNHIINTQRSFDSKEHSISMEDFIPLEQIIPKRIHSNQGQQIDCLKDLDSEIIVSSDSKLEEFKTEMGYPTNGTVSVKERQEESNLNEVGKSEKLLSVAPHPSKLNIKTGSNEEITSIDLLDIKENLKPLPQKGLTNDKGEKPSDQRALKKDKGILAEQKTQDVSPLVDDVTVLVGDLPSQNQFTPVEDITSPDKAFWLIFSGEYTKAMSKDWHSGHFCCWQCDESLTGQRYVLRDDHPYCIKCYEQVFANTCDECSKVIGIDSKDLSYKDKHWHEACFLCSKCRVSLVDKQFGSKADKIYCGNCYDAQFASRCDGCGQIFRAGTKKMEYKTRQWHEQCFCCCVCKTAIGTKSFIPREQEIYCATCYEEKFATRCVKCNKIITSGGVTYKNEPWHRECFTCTNCSTSLAGQRFTSRDEKPYCAECFGELFAKRCTACCKPITGIGGTRFISFEDRHWHNDCFICASCRSSLVGRGFITDAEDILCTECAKQKLM